MSTKENTVWLVDQDESKILQMTYQWRTSDNIFEKLDVREYRFVGIHSDKIAEVIWYHSDIEVAKRLFARVAGLTYPGMYAHDTHIQPERNYIPKFRKHKLNGKINRKYLGVISENPFIELFSKLKIV